MADKRTGRLKRWILEGYDRNCYCTLREEINKYNVHILGFFNVLVLLLLVSVFISGFFTGYVSAMRPIYVGTAIFTIAEMTVDRFVLFKSVRVLDGAVFLCMTKMYVFCVISGVYYSRQMPAISFSAFMIVLSILFIVKPWKMNLFNLAAVIIFSICSYKEKAPGIALSDIYNCSAFYLVSAAVAFWIIKLRVGSIRNEKLLMEQRDTDLLTTLPNRRRFDIYARESFETEKDREVNFLMMDIDHFKAYNDTKGHIAGDYCLERIGKALHKLGEEQKIFFARYGGEEFVAVDVTHDKYEIEQFAREIVRTVYELGLPHESSSFKRITISIGYASQSEVKANDYIQLLECADQALYMAKQQGRNKIAGYYFNKNIL